MVKFHRHRFAIVMLLSVIVLGGMYFGLDKSEFQRFKLNAFSASTGQKIPDIIVTLKTQSHLYDSGNNLISISNSKFFEDNPTLSIFAKGEKGEELGTLQSYLKMRAKFPSGNEKSTIIPLIVEKGSVVQIKVLAKDSKNHQITTETFEGKLAADIEFVWNKEGDLYFKDFPMSAITENLDDGDYESLMEVQVSGVLKIHYKGYANPTGSGGYTLVIAESTPLRTYHNISIEKVAGSKTSTNELPKGSTNELPKGDPEGTKSDIPGVVGELGDCVITWDTDCLGNAKFYGVYAIGFLGAVAYLFFNRKTGQVVGLERLN